MRNNPKSLTKIERKDLVTAVTFIAAVLSLSSAPFIARAAVGRTASPGPGEARVSDTNSGMDPFAVVLVPDTQYYSEGSGGAVPEMMYAQMRWIADNAQT